MHRRFQPRVAGGRRSEVKKENRAAPGSDDMSSVGYPSPVVRSDIQQAGHPERREAQWSK
jgi:hypothetical protein